MAEILRGELPPGVDVELLPSERGLCDHFQVRRMRLWEALKNQQQEGMIDISKGSLRRAPTNAQSSFPVTRPKTVAALDSLDEHQREATDWAAKSLNSPLTFVA